MANSRMSCSTFANATPSIHTESLRVSSPFSKIRQVLQPDKPRYILLLGLATVTILL
ncbi:hypothetical protein L210DRAFT_953972, partial [Boletus edulis BED1]